MLPNPQSRRTIFAAVGPVGMWARRQPCQSYPQAARPSRLPLASCRQGLNGLTGENEDQTQGIAIIRKAIQAPIRQIVENAGVEASIVVGKLLEQKSGTYGFDAQTEKYSDLIESGIVDPTKVVRVALQNAASVAALLITTEAMVADRPKKESGGGMPGGGMGGGGMGDMD